MLVNGACYIRVSTEDQTEYSPEAQLRLLKDYAKKNGIAMADAHIYMDEGISGKRADKRPAFMKMIAAARSKPRPFEVILVHKFDRFARSREDSVVYKSLLKKEAGIKVVSITESIEDDKFSVILEAMLEAMAEYYSLNLADEVKKGMFEKARRGENIGKAPFGYLLENSKLKPHPTEAEAVRLIFEMYKRESVTGVTQYLNENGFKTKTGGRWTQATIMYILQNPVYYGVLRYNYRKAGMRGQENPADQWILARANHTPLISKEDFDAAQERLASHAKIYGRNFKESGMKSWLQHLCRCEFCGAVLTISATGGKKYHAFRCSRFQLGACGTGSTMSARKLEAAALAQLKSDCRISGPISIEQNCSDDNTIAELERRLSRLENKYALIKKAFLAEIDNLEEYKENKRLLQQEETALQGEISKYRQAQASKIFTVENFLALLEKDFLSVEERNKIAKQFIKEVRVDLKAKEMGIIYYA